MGFRRLVAGVAGAACVAGIALLGATGTAAADVQTALGYATPAQPYFHNPDTTDWVGSYTWQGHQVWCVQFAYLAPDSNQQYQDGDELLTKWGDHLAPDVAADISYLLLRYSDTKSNDEAAALGHLLHSWTAAPKDASQLDPARTFREIAYDAPAHLKALPQSAQDAVARLTADAAANHGPWTAAITAPKTPQTIDQPGDWTITVTKSDGKGVGNVPVTLTLTDAKLADQNQAGTLKTPADGSPLVVKVVPTGANPKVALSADSPADKPVVHVPSNNPDMQRIVTTGGEKKLTGEATTTAVTAPGTVKVTKTDSDSHAPLAGAALRVTASDKVGPAVKQDGTPLLGQDGKPLVVQTGADGTATVPDLRTPQNVCLIEVAAPQGYEQGFDPNAPPSTCGIVAPGQVLALALANKPNKPIVPSTIPAGDEPPLAVAKAAVVSQLRPAGLVGFGGLVLLGVALAGGLVWRGAVRRR
jgi:hypothetical protein